jgi:DNA-binding LytR/AlgR family response regulator
MPGMDGIETAKEIQKVDSKQKIIFITGYGNDVIPKLKQLTNNASVMNKPSRLKHYWQKLKDGQFPNYAKC